MKIAFVSNFFNHHQKQLSDALSKMDEVDYCFVETMPMPDDRKTLGYSMRALPDYVSVGHTYEERQKICNEKLTSTDILLAGSAPETILKYCRRKSKLIFRYAERPLKKGVEPLKYFPRLLKWHIRNPVTEKIYLLSASAYAPGDYRKFGLFHKKAYKWGYFPEIKRYENIEDLLKQKNRRTILWCGRLIAWKHPEQAVYIAKRLRNDGYLFKMDIIGCGEMESFLKKMIENENLSDCVHLLGSMNPEKVRNHMEQAGIYLFTSDKREGWGAVLNESMNSCCAVVASRAVGAVPYLITNKENGMVYDANAEDMLYQQVKYLLDYPNEQQRLGRNAYKTILEEWNADIAAERLVKLSKAILSGDKYPDLYRSGPCSRAEVISENWNY